MNRRWTMAAGLAVVLAGGVRAERIRSGAFAAELDPGIPAVRAYARDGHTVRLPAPAEGPVLRINGRPAQPRVAFRLAGPDRAAYELVCEELKVAMTLEVVITRNALHFTLADIAETGTTPVKTIELPGLVLVAGRGGNTAALGNFPGAGYGSDKPEDMDIFGTVADLAEGAVGASYAFVSDGEVCAGLYSNVLDEENRMRAVVSGGALTVVPGVWTWRSEIPGETVAPPRATLVVAGDENGDGRVTWQDGAVAYRANTPAAYGAAKTCQYPIAHIAMNFGSQATNPFLRVLDNAKKLWLYTDGLGQRIQFKGFQSEGHDSSHPDYAGNVGRRMGGRDDLNFVMRRAHDFNVLCGVHINAHEYHTEARWFTPELVNLDRIGWSWLDESYLVDYRHDAVNGTLHQRLAAMREDLPWLDFVYLDVYFGRGWVGWNMHNRINGLGLLQFTEFPGVMERAVVWNHVAHDWTQAVWGKGDPSEIARFIHYSGKDTFHHEPVLRGANCDGFMGWHAERDLLQTVRSAFTVNLPTKYLQHFALLRWAPGAEAVFDRGVRATAAEGVAEIFGPDGQLINRCRYAAPRTRPIENRLFIPWDPLSEEKIYHWNDEGGDSTWTLPRSWAGVRSALLYRLTDRGRVYERDVPVAGDGQVTLAGIAARTPYVLYRRMPPPLPDITWGEGGLVVDPGFDSHSFRSWRPEGEGIRPAIDTEGFGQTELLVEGTEPAAVSQAVDGLTPGEVYAASVWVSIDGRRRATLAVSPDLPTLQPGMDPGRWKVIGASTPHHPGEGPERLLDGSADTLWHTAYGETTPAHPHHVTIDLGEELILEGFVQTARANLHNGAIKGFEAWTSLDNETWHRAATGDFAYDGGPQAAVAFDEPVRARYFRLAALSEWQGGPWASSAELALTGRPVRGSDPQPEFVELTRSIDQTAFINYTDQSSKYLRNWHRMKILFTAPASGRAVLGLRVSSGAGAVRFDDVRLVRSGISTPPTDARNVVLYEDFENVDEGWGPFLYGWQGPMNTHLSEAHAPYTDDTIGGQYSLKSRNEDSPGMLYRTVPATLALAPRTTYRVSFDYLSNQPECFKVVAGSDAPDAPAPVETLVPDGSWMVQPLAMTFTTGDDADWYIGLSKVERERRGTLVIDHLLVERVPQ